MKSKDVKCPVCGAMNYRLNLEETKGWMECVECGEATLVDEIETGVVRFPVYEMKDLPKIIKSI